MTGTCAAGGGGAHTADGKLPAGAWAEFRPEVRQVSSSVVFTDGTLCVGDRPVMAVASVWKVLGAT